MTADVYGIIGCPVGHSMSPEIHNLAFQDLLIDAVYHRFHVEKRDLEAAVKGIRALGIKGVNVTIPHKEDVIPFLDAIDETAARMGAVNTIVNEDGRLKGYNTDGQGYVESILPYLDKELSEISCLIIGAGGAARGIYSAMAHAETGRVDLANRTSSRAYAILESCSAPVSSKVITLNQAQCSLADYDLIIQTTSIGMSPKEQAKPISLAGIVPGTIVSDIIYNPVKTAFLQEAEKHGCRIVSGVGMFIYQAALSFRHWTGKMPDVKAMEAVVLQKLGGSKIC
ncbi:shikimate dehydrogenase [Metabacillus sp. 113a]|uniref:shikimate dehydrogenase n=1 Tax=Metabacillus sp. 113a TaxID=3404706 RepID=UPI003CE9117D